MSCPGLHCPGCSEGQSLGIAAAAGLVVADQTVQCVADRIWWIGGTVTACFALAVVAGFRLERWNDRRAATWGAARGIVSRADVVMSPPVRAVVIEREPERPTIAPQIVNFNFYGADAAPASAIIRQAPIGKPEDAIAKARANTPNQP